MTVDTNFEELMAELHRMLDETEEPGYTELCAGADKPVQKRRSRAGKILSGIVFYLVLATAVATAFLYGTRTGAKNFLGYSYANVLTRSMQSEIPQGSLVLVKHVDPAEIQVGDDVTYLPQDGSTVTHRVMTIYENYNESGIRGFVTKGVENPAPDPDVVYATNLVGVVRFHVAGLGALLSDVAGHIWVIAGMFALLLLLSFSLRSFFGAAKNEKNAKQRKPPRSMAEPT